MALMIRTTGVEEFLDDTGGFWLKCLILGAPSAGKTRSASYWPAPIFADCEKGRMSLADRKVPFAEITTSADMEDLLRAMEAEGRKPVEKRKYRTLVIDTLDAYQRILIQERLTAKRQEALQGFADWGFLDAKMTGLVTRLMRLPMNLVVNVHTKDKRDGDEGPLITEPKLKGDIRDQIAGDFDLVGLMTTAYQMVDKERVLTRSIQWHPEPKYPTLKDRSGNLPKHTDVTFADSDYTTIFEAITASLDELAPSETLEELPESEPTVAPEPVRPGGVVTPKAEETTAVAAAAKRAPAAPKAAPKARAVKTPAPKAAVVTEVESQGDVAVAPIPVQENATTTPPPWLEDPDAGKDVAVRVLGATPVDETPIPSVEEPAVLEPERGVQPPAPVAVAATDAKHCGDSAGSADPKPGCGKDLTGENKDFVNIAEIRYGTSLCPACMRRAA